MTEPRKTQPGFLACDRCQRTVPFTRTIADEVDLVRAPKHKCRDWEVRMFERWVDHDPFLAPLPPTKIEETTYE
jgi:hypothetical protein